jgi:hypothetical protein
MAHQPRRARPSLRAQGALLRAGQNLQERALRANGAACGTWVIIGFRKGQQAFLSSRTVVFGQEGAKLPGPGVFIRCPRRSRGVGQFYTKRESRVKQRHRRPRPVWKDQRMAEKRLCFQCDWMALHIDPETPDRLGAVLA